MQVILAPSNLGLRPLRPGRAPGTWHEPGAWRAPEALVAAGLLAALGGPAVAALPRPVYAAEARTGSRILNGPALRAFNLALADRVAAAVTAGAFALVVGGDCGILPGALAGARAAGSLALVHVDGHSDFRHPGNYDFARAPGAAAGMDLALATGRGEALGTDWPGVAGPLVADAHVVQVGEREGREPDYAWPDVADTAIHRIDVFEALRLGGPGLAARVTGLLAAMPVAGWWVHLDVDVLDRAVMPAVDRPGAPGLPPDDLAALLAPLVADPRCRGLTLTVYDPDLDPDGGCAATLVALVGRLRFRGPA